MKKFVTLSVTALAALTLAACGSNSSSKGVDTVKSSKTSQASSSKKDTHENQHVTNGSPIKVGQWKYYDDFDADGTLVKVATPKKVVTQGKVTVTINSIKVFSMKPKNTDAKKTASDYFGASGVTDPYYVIQANWSAKNADSKELQTNGIKSFVVNGQQYAMGSGLQDSGTGASLASGASSDFEADALLKSSDYQSIKSMTINLDSIADTTSYEDVAPATSINVNF